MPFFLDESRDLAVAQIPRCGINTIREWLGRDAILVPNNDPRLLAVTRRVAFVRSPVDRLESAFSLFYWMDDYGDPHVSNAPVDSWENFVDHVLDVQIKDDEHWKPQSEHVGDIPNTYHRLENLFDRFEQYRPGILPHYNKTSRSPLILTYRTTELRTKYADDLVLYNGAT